MNITIVTNAKDDEGSFPPPRAQAALHEVRGSMAKISMIVQAGRNRSSIPQS
jgi:hypothetical protein